MEIEETQPVANEKACHSSRGCFIHIRLCGRNREEEIPLYPEQRIVTYFRYLSAPSAKLQHLCKMWYRKKFQRQANTPVMHAMPLTLDQRCFLVNSSTSMPAASTASGQPRFDDHRVSFTPVPSPYCRRKLTLPSPTSAPASTDPSETRR